MKYSAFKILYEGLTGNRGWKAVWREPEPKQNYEVVIIGGGGHGLSTAYYLSKIYGIRNIAVLEKGWLGSGNIGRNTTIIRSNYLLPGNEPFYEFSLKLWEGLEQDFNYNAMVSQRGILNLSHSDGQHDAFARRGNAMHLTNSGAILLDQADVKAFDSLVSSGNVGAIKLAVNGIKAQYDNTNGYEGRMLQGKPPQTSRDVFRSQQEVVAAMSDPRYEKDPAYRQDLVEKLDRSQNVKF